MKIDSLQQSAKGPAVAAFVPGLNGSCIVQPFSAQLVIFELTKSQNHFERNARCQISLEDQHIFVALQTWMSVLTGVIAIQFNKIPKFRALKPC